MKGSAYSALASYYTQITGKDYEKAQEYLIAELQNRNVGFKGLDIGCGAGQTLLALHSVGYRMTGVDISQEMLEKASALLQGKKVPLFKQDMSAMRLPETYDFAYVLTDGFNYIPPEKAEKTVRAIAKAVKREGVLYLDLSSEYKLKTILANNVFAEDGEDFTYLWFNRQTERGVEMDLSFFVKRKDGAYEKREEAHTQYFYSVETLTDLLTANGFTVTDVRGENGAPYTENSHRLSVWAKRN